MEIPPDLYRIAVVVLVGIVFLLYARIQRRTQENFRNLPENGLATSLGSSGMIQSKNVSVPGFDCSKKPDASDTAGLMMYNMECAKKKADLTELEETVLNASEAGVSEDVEGAGGVLSRLRRNKRARTAKEQSERDRLELNCALGALNSPDPKIAYGALRVIVKNRLTNYCRLSNRIIDKLASGKKILNKLDDAKARKGVLKDLRKSGVKPQRCDILMNLPPYSAGAGRIFWSLRKVRNTMISEIRNELNFYNSKLKDLSSVASTLQSQKFDTVNQDDYIQKAKDEDNYKDAFTDFKRPTEGFLEGFQDKCYGLFDEDEGGGGRRGRGERDDDEEEDQLVGGDTGKPDSRLLRREVDRVRRIIQSPDLTTLEGFINQLNGQIDGLDEAQRKISEQTDGPRKSYVKYDAKDSLQGFFAQLLEFKNYRL